MDPKPSQVKERILTVASRLFYEQGYQATGINQIIEEASIAKASLYKHFPAKSDLLQAYLIQKDESWFQELDHFLTHKKSSEEKILAIFDFRQQKQNLANFQGCPFVKINAELLPQDEFVLPILAKHKNRLLAYIQELIRSGQEQASKTTSSELASTLFFLMEGAGVAVSINKNIDALVQAKKIAAGMLS